MAGMSSKHGNIGLLEQLLFLYNMELSVNDLYKYLGFPCAQHTYSDR